MLVKYSAYNPQTGYIVTQMTEMSGIWYNPSYNVCVIAMSDGLNNLLLEISKEEYSSLLNLMEKEFKSGSNVFTLTDMCYEAGDGAFHSEEIISEAKRCLRKLKQFESKAYETVLKVELDLYKNKENDTVAVSTESEGVSNPLERKGYL